MKDENRAFESSVKTKVSRAPLSRSRFADPSHSPNPMKTSQHSIPSRQAFTRLELIVVLCTLALLTAVAWPVLASNKPRADRIACVNNLRQIGKAFNSWASDHGDWNPWLISTSAGGNQDYPNGAGSLIRVEVWFQFSWVSNELGSPKVLADPGDTNGRPGPLQVATSWDEYPSGGFLNGAYGNNAVSYFIGLHAVFARPQSLLCGDRNVPITAKNALCVTTIPCDAISAGPGTVVPLSIGWTNAVHGENGNLLSNDGQVRQVGSAGLRKALDSDATDGAPHHFLFPF